MFNKFAVSALCLALITGCDDSKKVDEVQAITSEQEDRAEQKVNKTELYLPGGAGVDFRRLPLSDKVIKDKTSKIRIVVYGFKESYSEVDKSVSSVLQAEEYARRVNAPGQNKLSVSYLKKNASAVLFRYSTVDNGVEAKTFVTVSWRF